MPQLSEVQRGMIIGAYLVCHNIRLVSRILNLPRSTVQRWINRYEQSKSVARRSGSGRPRRTARSPDLNPIEHVWDILGRRMQHRACENLNQLFEALREEWDSIPQEDLDQLISSMPRRVGAVIEKRGGNTRY